MTYFEVEELGFLGTPCGVVQAVVFCHQSETLVCSVFYTRREMGLRITLVYCANYFSSGLGGLIAAAIFHIPESTGLRRWQVSF